MYTEYTQADVSRKLDVSRMSATQALKDTSPKLEKIRCRIVKLLGPCRVERKRIFLMQPGSAELCPGRGTSLSQW